MSEGLDPEEEMVTTLSIESQGTIVRVITEPQNQDFYLHSDLLWQQQHVVWKEHQQAYLDRERANLLLQKAIKDLSEYKDECNNRDETKLGKIKEGLEKVAEVVRYVPDPTGTVQTAASAIEIAATITNIINQVWTTANVVVAEHKKNQAEKTYEGAKVLAKKASEKLVEYEKQLRDIEAKSYEDCAAYVEKLAGKMHVRSTWGELDWETWCCMVLGQNSFQQLDQDAKGKYIEIYKTQVPLLIEYIAIVWQGKIRKKKRDMLEYRQAYAHQLQKERKIMTALQKTYEESKVNKTKIAQQCQYAKHRIEELLKAELEGILDEFITSNQSMKEKERFTKCFDELSRLSTVTLPDLTEAVGQATEAEVKDHMAVMEHEQVLEGSKVVFERQYTRMKQNIEMWEKQMRNHWGECDESYQPYTEWVGLEEVRNGSNENVSEDIQVDTNFPEIIGEISHPVARVKELITRGKQLLWNDENSAIFSNELTFPVQVSDVELIERSFCSALSVTASPMVTDSAEQKLRSISSTSDAVLLKETVPLVTDSEMRSCASGDNVLQKSFAVIKTPVELLLSWSLDKLDVPLADNDEVGSMNKRRWELRKQLNKCRVEQQRAQWKLSQFITTERLSSVKMDDSKSVLSLMTAESRKTRAPTRLTGYTASTALSDANRNNDVVESAADKQQRFQEECNQCNERKASLLNQWSEQVRKAELYRKSVIDPRPLGAKEEDIIDAFAVADDRVLEEEYIREKFRKEQDAARELQDSWESNAKRWKIMMEWEDTMSQLQMLEKQRNDLSVGTDGEAVVLNVKYKKQLECCKEYEQRWLEAAKQYIASSTTNNNDTMDSEKYSQRSWSKLKQLDANVVKRWYEYRKQSQQMTAAGDAEAALQHYIEKRSGSRSIAIACELEAMEAEYFVLCQERLTVEIAGKEYLKYVLQEALQHAVEKVDGVEEMWNEKVKKGKLAMQQLNETLFNLSTVDAKKHAELVAVQAHEKAWRCYQKEKHRLDKIESIWASIDERKELLQKQAVDEAVYQYEICQDSSAWEQLSLAVRGSYNDRVGVENQIYYTGEKIEEDQLNEIMTYIKSQEGQLQQFLTRMTNTLTGNLTAKINLLKVLQQHFLQRKEAYMKQQIQDMQAMKWMEWKELTAEDRQCQWIGLLTEKLQDKTWMESIVTNMQMRNDFISATHIKTYLQEIGWRTMHLHQTTNIKIISNLTSFYNVLTATASQYYLFTGKYRKSLKGHTSTVVSLVMLLDGRLVSGSDDKTIRIWNVSTGVCEYVLKGHTDWVGSLVVLLDGRLASGSQDSTIRIWNVSTGVCEHVVEGLIVSVGTLVELLDGRLAFSSFSCTVRIWNVSTGVCEHVLAGHIGCVVSLVVLLDGRLASGSYDKTIRIWNVSTGVCEHVLEGHTGWVVSLLVLLDGRLSSNSFDGSIRIWNVSGGVCEHVLEGHTDSVGSLVVLLDGRLAYGGNNKSIRIWNVSTGVCEHVLEGHTNDVRSLVLLLDGRLASSSRDKTIRIWNVSTGVCEHVLEGHTSWVLALSVLLDGRLASGSYDKTIRIWK